MKLTAVIEQTYKYRKRMKYISQTDTFIEKDIDSLGYVRNVKYPYGWIKETGTPPQPHLDVFIMTDRDYELGDETEVNIIGVFWRTDGDHKLVAVLPDNTINDYYELDEEVKENLRRLYKGKYDGEGWYGRERADKVIKCFFDEN